MNAFEDKLNAIINKYKGFTKEQFQVYFGFAPPISVYEIIPHFAPITQCYIIDQEGQTLELTQEKNCDDLAREVIKPLCQNQRNIDVEWYQVKILEPTTTLEQLQKLIEQDHDCIELTGYGY